jgi:hypothetical protein
MRRGILQQTPMMIQEYFGNLYSSKLENQEKTDKLLDTMTHQN